MSYINVSVQLPGLDRKSTKVAVFDLDGTLIKPIGKNKFSVTDSDWAFENDNVIPTLKRLYDDGFDIVIVSNQKALKDSTMWENKIRKISTKIGIPILALASLEDDQFRKPRVGLWTKFLSGYDKNISFFCGDAGGLPKRKINGVAVNKDFSDSDLKFALNVGIKFYHRDEYFYGIKGIVMQPNYIDFDEVKRGKYDDLVIGDGTMVINVGMPGSGKSYFSKNHIKSSGKVSVYINRDTLGTIPKCIALCEKSAKDRFPIIIDNTNPTKADRKQFIDIAKRHGYTVVCINFTTPKEIAMHNNIYRGVTNGLTIVPKIVYNMFGSKYEKPSTDEGINKVYTMDFILDSGQAGPEYFKYFY